MKTIFYSSLIASCFSIVSSCTYSQDTTAVQEDTAVVQENTTVFQEEINTDYDGSQYIILTDEKFKEIESKMELQDDWNPIIIKGYSKAELVAFYVQTYSDETIATWVDFAYKKILNFENISPEQDAAFQKVLGLPRSKENAHRFMMLMTTEQIETVGY